jgi:hypothetical protein
VVIPRTNSIVNNEFQYTADVMVSEDRGVTWRGVMNHGLRVISDPAPGELAAEYLRASGGHIAGRAGRMCLASRP